MAHRRSVGRAGVALVAAYALALQALLASFGVADALVRHQLPAIAGAICTFTADWSPPVVPVDHDHADCCVLCSAPAPGSIGPIDALMWMVGGASPSRLIVLDGPQSLGMIAWLPGGARAPPSRI